ncbi:histidine phosphatase family protein [Candidatus Gracilibacteria bacterium]|nr:histidine phosphatase family protein [Candidatus Gracilibacteria bacterium]
MGVAIFAIAVWLFWRSHRDLGNNWSPTLEVRKGHTLITQGIYQYIRHPQTDKDYADQADPKMKLDDCETQRKLNDVGIKQAKDIGAAFTAKKIPVDEVITSEYCRAWKTADLAFGKHKKNAKLNFLPFEEYTEEQVQQMKTNVTPLLTTVPPSGKNTVIVGHDDIFEAATGIYPDPQGMAYVLTPDGKGGFVIQANMLPEDWSKL